MDFCFFFFKQKTAYEMRISDWSSDVCSSDLSLGDALHLSRQGRGRARTDPAAAAVVRQAQVGGGTAARDDLPAGESAGGLRCDESSRRCRGGATGTGQRRGRVRLRDDDGRGERSRCGTGRGAAQGGRAGSAGPWGTGGG